MKKLLALVLALVMTLGLATVGASAATYTDANDIEYEEAVDVMSAIGVLQGDNGAFNPKGTLTREQGAKIISYMLLGQTAGDALTASAAPFADVAANRWSAGAIQYCKNAGILDGVGDGKFAPDASLSGAAFAKMLLTALGYEAKREGLTGADWQLNVVRLVNKIDLATGLGSMQYSGQITRDVAAKLAFNTLTKDMVNYPGALTVTTGDGTTVSTGANATPVENKAYSYVSVASAVDEATTANVGSKASGNEVEVVAAGVITTGYMQFCENYFPNLKVAKKTDEFGHTVDYWYLADSRTDYTFDNTNSKDLAKAVTSDVIDTVVATLYKTKDITYADLYKLGDWDAAAITVKENNANSTRANPTVQFDNVNGVGVVAGSWKGSTAKVNALTNIDNAGANYDGCKVEFVDQDGNGKIDAILVTYGYLAKVTKVTAATASKDRSINVEVASAKDANDTLALNGYVTDDFEKDDYIIVYPKENMATTPTKDFLKAELASEKVTGETTAVTGTAAADSYTGVTIAGTSYSVGSSAELLPALTVASTGRTTVDAYLLNDYILGVVVTSGVTTADMSNIVYALADDTNGINPDTGKSTYYVQAAKMDGTLETIKTTNNVSGTVAGAGWYVTKTTSSQPDFVAPTNNAASPAKIETTLAKIDNTACFYVYGAMAAKNLTPTTKYVSFDDAGATAATNAYLTDSTAYIFVKNDKASITVGGITRANAAPTSVLVGKNASDGSYEVAAMIFTNDSYSEAVSSDVVFVSSATAKGVNGSKNVFQGYDLEGNKVDVVANSDPGAVGFYSYTVDANGVWTLSAVDTGDTDVTKGAYQFFFSAAASANITRHDNLLSIDDGINAISALDTTGATFTDLDGTLDWASVSDLAAATGKLTSGYIYVVDGVAKEIIVTEEDATGNVWTLTYDFTTDSVAAMTDETDKTQNVEKGATVTVAAKPAEKSGYQFIGWLNDQDSKLYAAGDEVTVGADTKLAAVFVTTAVVNVKSAVTTYQAMLNAATGATVTLTGNGATDVSASIAAQIAKVNGNAPAANKGTVAVTNAAGDLTLKSTETDAVTALTAGQTMEITLTVTYNDAGTATFTVVGTSAD